MKKVIFTGAVLMTFLIGCSFSKPTTEANSTAKAEKMGIAEIIRTADLKTISDELNEFSTSQLNSFNEDGKTIYDIALERGNFSIINLLLGKKVSPFKPNKNGQSLYTKLGQQKSFSFWSEVSPNTQQEEKIFSLISSQASATIKPLAESEDWYNLKEKLEAFEIPCDKVLSEIMSRSKGKIALSDVAKSPACRFSLSEVNTKFFYSKLLKLMSNSKFSNFMDVETIYSILPEKLKFLKIYDPSGGYYMIHTEVIIQTLRDINPIKADELLRNIERQRSNDAIAITFSWLKNKSDPKSLSTKVIQRFNEAHDDSIDTIINKAIIGAYASQHAEEKDDQ